MTSVTTCVCVCVVYDSVKVKVVYTKKSLYPPEGGEYCLEELRALQYPCNDDNDNRMETTPVIHQHITTIIIPVIQLLCHIH